MKQNMLAVLSMMILCISGCAKSLPPREEINQAIKKSLDATGLNYASKTRVTNLSMPKQDSGDTSSDKRLKYLGTGLDIVRGFSMNIDGAIDMKAKKSEVRYDLQYSKDNVDVSIKLPLLVDYGTQTIYIGTSFLNTILDAIYPQPPENKGKLIRINFNELLKETATSAPELSKLVGENRLSSKNMEVINGAFKAGIVKSLAKLNNSCFSEQPLSELDKKAGVERRVLITLGHSDSIAVIMDLIDSVSQALFQEGVISKKEYSVILTLTEKETIDGLTEKFTMGMIYDVSVAHSGLVSSMVSRLNVADKEGNYQIGIENVSSFDSYNSPHFSIHPEANRTIDFKEVLDAIMADKASIADKAEKIEGTDAPTAVQPAEEAPGSAPDGTGTTGDAEQSGR